MFWCSASSSAFSLILSSSSLDKITHYLYLQTCTRYSSQCGCSMRFKQGKKGTEMPHLDLVPLMDVILTVLTFFVLSSMALTRQQAVEVSLPNASAGATQQKTPDPLVVGLNQQGQILLANKPASKPQLVQQMQSYLVQNPRGAVILKADRELPYQRVVQILGEMRDVGGDRVALAIEES